jgi:tetratricopeptide (TPR) repeat protein
VLVLAAAIRWVTLGAPGFTNARLADDVANPLLRHPWWPACLLTPLYAAAYAWFLHFWPIRLKVDYGFDAFPVLTTAAQPALWKAAAVLAATAAAGWYWRRVPALAAGMALFFLGFLPASNLLYINRDLFSERALTLAGTGWAVVVAAAYAGLTRWAGRAHSGIMLQRALTAGVAIALLLAAGRSYRRVVAWRSTDSIWQQALHDAPASTRAWRAILDNRLGRAAAFKDMNALEEAHKMALRAIESDPRAARHYEAFAHVHLTRAALEPNPHLAVVSFGQAVRMMQRAVDLEPGSLALQESLARLLEDSAVRGFDGQGRTKAIEVWRRVVNEHPDREQAWRELYRLYMETNQRTPADQLRPLFQAAHPEAPPL